MSMMEANANKETLRVIKKIGYVHGTKIDDTLQGSVWKIYKSGDKKCDTAVLKSTSKNLHCRSIGIASGQELKVQENIFTEQRILRRLTKNDECPSSIVKFRWFFKTHTDYYLLMENGGSSLFEFVTEAHQMIEAGHLQRSEWIKLVTFVFKQLVECIDYIHSKRVCHFDISLENLLINEVICKLDNLKNNKPRVNFVMKGIQIKLCDFGLAQFFDKNTDFQSDRFCGKRCYRSPEAVSRESDGTSFDAKKNDIWAMGCCLFMMLFGCRPWNVADDSDQRFMYMERYSLTDLLKKWNIESHADQQLLSLLNSIFQCEADRISLERIKQCMRF